MNNNIIEINNMISKKELQYLNYIKQTNNIDEMVVFDIGGNKGHYSVNVLNFFKNKINKIYIFEPVPRFCDIIKNRFIEIDKIEIFPFACSDKKSSETFFEIISPENQSAEGLSSFNKRDVYKNFNHKEIKVNCIKLDDFIQKNKIDKIHFIKIDTEGHELKILKGLKQSLIDGKVMYIQIEYGDCLKERGHNLNDILNLIKDTDYKIYDFLNEKFIEINEKNLESYKNITWDNYLITKNKM